MRILVTGATGFVGKKLGEVLIKSGHELIVLSRDGGRAQKTLGYMAECHSWDPLAGPPPEVALRQIDAVINLMGESIAARRWSAAQKKRIQDSRVIGTRHLILGLKKSEFPQVFIQASAIGIYPPEPTAILTEQTQAGTGFLPEVCQAWEGSLTEAALSCRQVILRIGVVLGANGGALAKLLPLFKMGLGGRVGSGKQWMSWIHVDDLVKVIVDALENKKYSGVFNATAPEPVQNDEFTRALAQALHRPAFLPAPALALKLALGEMSSIILDSQRVLPKRLQEVGHEFLFSRIDEAMRNIVG